MAKDNTKYQFKGNVFGKGPLVFAVIKNYIEENQPNFTDLVNEFSKENVSVNECIISRQKFQEKLAQSDDVIKRYFDKKDEKLITKDGVEVLVCSQWGIGNINVFVNHSTVIGFTVLAEQDGETIVSLFNKYREKPNTTWIKSYQQFCTQVATNIGKDSSDYSEQFMLSLWKTIDNGIANVSPGGLSKDDYENLLPELPSITKKILDNPSSETLADIYKWARKVKSEGKFKFIKWGVIHRVFSAVDPQKITTLLNEDHLKKLVNTLNQRYAFNIVLSDNWLKNNIALKKALSEIGVVEEDSIFVNTFIWKLYIDLVQNYQAHYQQVTEPEAGYDENKTMDEPTFTLSEKPLNQIFYGPPGTGKTYQLQQLIKNYTSEPEVVDPNIWVDEHLNELTWMQVIALCLLDIGEKSKVKQIINHEYYQRKAKLNNRQGNLAPTAWSFLQQFTTEDSKTVSYKSRSEPSVFDKTSNSEWYIVRDKLELIDDISALYQTLKEGPQSKEVIKRYSSTTFHQSYGYEEFIQGLKAKSTKDNGISYAVEPGVFAKLCNRANKDPNHKYAMFIDEINRGNISKIFGELITLIEPDKRKGCTNEMMVQLTYDGEQFSVPANVDIIGTMNTADRSLAMMDTALRRRFDFVEMMPKPELFAGKSVNGIQLDLLLSKMNERIEVLYDREHTLGHAFFMPVSDKIDSEGEDKAFVELQHVFRNKIIPLLEEYFFEDWNKISLVLGDNRKNSKALTPYVFIKKHIASYNDIFGENHGLETYEDKKTTFKLADFDDEHSAWNNHLAYQAIYDETVLEKADKTPAKDEEYTTGEDSVVAEKSNA
jgi:5-methylcytosine-specific restriction protein B